MTLYRLLVRLAFPAAFGRRFGDDMAEVFADRLARARSSGWMAVVSLWLRTAGDVCAHGVAERRLEAAGRRRRTTMIDALKQDVTFGWRTLRRAPGIAVTAVVTLALGIGASTAVFSVADALVLQSLPYPAADRLVALTDDNEERGDSVNVALPNFDDWRASVDAIEAAAAWQTADMNLVGATAAERVVGAAATEEIFDVLGAVPILGRTFGRETTEPGMQTVVVLSEGAWRRVFGGREEIVGESAVLDGVPHTIVGVVPSVAGLIDVDVWRPIVRTGAAARRTSHGFRAIARLRSDSTIDGARVQFDVVAARLAAAYPESNSGWTVGLTPLQDTLGEDLDQVLILVGSVAGVLLLIACTNVAGLLVARAADRRREFAVRTALGAPRRRLVRQLLTESVLLSLAGAAGGLVVASWTTGLIVSLLPDDVALWRQPALSVSVLAFATGVAVATGLLFGLAPAVSTTRGASQEQLRDGMTSTSVATRRLRHGLVFVQITLASVLLAGAGLLGTSLWQALRVDSGLDDLRSVLTFRVTPPRSTHTDAAALRLYFDSLLDRLEALPQVEAAGAISSLPMADNDTISTIRRPDEPVPARGDERWALLQISTPGYLRASGTRLVAGRDFTGADTAGSESVVIVNETLARELWPDGSPIGQQLMLEADAPSRVIGLIADVRHFGLDQSLYRQYFVPLSQVPARAMSVALRLRSALPPEQLRQALAAVDPTVPLYSLRTLESMASGSLASRRSLTGTVAVCGAAAVLLAAIGLYGIVSTGVRERRREIGIRLALGATAGRVVGLLVRRAVVLAAAGIAAGLITSYWTTGLVEEFLFGVEPLDAATLSAMALTLLGISTMATWLSARHAAQVSPIESLKEN
ncbi:MAG TPA: ABC transporter permease [Vicinamibacterales bacterium]|nr:ABC transporter permease [Vicinamibacterales bacterium]